MNKKAKQVFSSLAYGFLAQTVSLVLSLTMALIVPKLLGVADFGYWQFFTFIGTYLCFFHLGIVDGVLLRYAGKDILQLNHSLLFSQLLAMLAFQILVSVLAMCILPFLNIVWQYKLIFASGTLFMILSNTSTYMGYIFQATDNTRWYSVSIMLQKGILFACTFLMLVLKINYFWFLILANLLGLCGTLAYCFFKGKVLFQHGLEKDPAIIKAEFKTNVFVGCNLLLSFIFGSLILGVGKFAVNSRWSIEDFGQLAFAISLVNMFLLFAGQFGIVMFPFVKKLNPQNMPQTYVLINHAVSVLLCGLLVFYLPVKYFLLLWLPQYEASFTYFTLAVAMVLYDGKMNTVNNVFLKAMRKERVMLAVNFFGFILSGILVFFAAFVFNSIFLVVVAVVLATIIRSMLFECYISRLLEVNFWVNMFYEFLLVLFFVVFVALPNSIFALCIYLILYGVYVLINRDSLRQIIKNLK